MMICHFQSQTEGSSRGKVNPIVTKYVYRNSKERVTYQLSSERNDNLKFKNLRSDEKHAYRERLSKLQKRKIVVPRLIDWSLFAEYGCEMQLREMMRMSYVYPGDGDEFVDLSWERAFSIYEDVYREWCLEFFSTFYFERKVYDILHEVCIWFRLCGKEHAYTLPQFAVHLGLYEADEVNNRLFGTHFVGLKRYHNRYDGISDYWNRIGDPSCLRRNASRIRNPLMKILHKLITWGVSHRTGSNDKCNNPDLWLMKLLEEDRNGNAAWIIAEYLSRRAPGIKDRSDVCGGHYVTALARNLGYFEDDELAKCSEPLESETWDAKGFGKALNKRARSLGEWTEPEVDMPQQQQQQPPQQTEGIYGYAPGSFDSGWGNWHSELNDIERRDVWRDSMLMRQNYNYDYSMPMLQHIARENDYEVPAYEPPNVPPYPIPYEPYPGPYPYPYPGYSPFPEPYPPYGRVPNEGSVNVGGPNFEVGGSSSQAGVKKRRMEVDDEDEEEESDELIHSDQEY